jgi:UDPglucose 6-dehydrogenase
MITREECDKIMKIVMIGTGYVGLVTGACFAEYGNTVTCVDVDKSKIDALNNGEIPIYEPNLDEMVARNTEVGALFFSTDLAQALSVSDVCFICVGTPQDKTGATDLSYVRSAAADIGDAMDHPLLIVNKSTVPVGTADIVREIIEARLASRGAGIDFSVASNPEFLKEGDAINDCMHPDRIVVGVADARAGAVLHELYRPFMKKHDRYIEMDVRSAEMTKYAANSMLAAKISFMNEMANICERVGADINKVRIGVGSDARIGYSFMYPGVGYGGSCFPKDLRSLISVAAGAGWDAEILKAVDSVNTRQKSALCQKITKKYGEDLGGLTFAVWGVSFKPNTDDMREAPSLVIIRDLIARGAGIKAYDPKAMKEAREKYFRDEVESGALVLTQGKYEAAEGAHALLLLTEWKEFTSPDFGRLASVMAAPVIFDGRNQYDDDALAALGFEYVRIGRGA